MTKPIRINFTVTIVRDDNGRLTATTEGQTAKSVGFSDVLSALGTLLYRRRDALSSLRPSDLAPTALAELERLETLLGRAARAP